MINANKLQDFFSFLRKSPLRQINFFFTFFLFCLLPTKNFYFDLNIVPQKPPIRVLQVDLPEVSRYPVNITGASVPSLSAASFLVIDAFSKTVIAAKNPEQRLFPASTTKVMTALVSLDHYQPGNILTVGGKGYIGETMGLQLGEKISFENLLYGLLVQSGNDAAEVLAQNYPGGEPSFVKAMNEKAQKLNLTNTNFVNPAGIDTPNHFSTTRDLAILGSEAMKNEIFQKIVGTQEITVKDTSGKITHNLVTINKLLGKVEGLKGIKTGWTQSAGECLIAYTEREGQKIISVVLASQDRFGETQTLIEWVFANFRWLPPATPQLEPEGGP